MAKGYDGSSNIGQSFLVTIISVLFFTFIIGYHNSVRGEADGGQLLIEHKPTLYIIGDSTVNSSGQQCGWGNIIGEYFDPNKIEVKNRARGGRSSRSYLREGLWSAVQAELIPGDYVLMQFGHNDGGYVTSVDGRASLKGIGPESQKVTLADASMEEQVLTYGAYLHKYITETQAKGAIPIVCSPVPRNMWNKDNSKILRNDRDYGLWARQVAENCKVSFIELNEITALKYEKLGRDKVNEFFPGDHTHTNRAGAKVNAESVIEGLESLENCDLKEYIKRDL